MGTRVGSLTQQLKEARNGGGKRRKGIVRVYGSRMVTRVSEICRETDIENAFAGMYESSNSDSPREWGARVSVGTRLSPMAAVQTNSRSIYGEGTDEK